MRNLIVCTLLLAYAVLPFQTSAYAQSEQNTTEKEQSESTGYEEKSVVILSAPTAYYKLNTEQKEHLDRVLALLRQPPEDQPSASQRLRNHPTMSVGMALQSNPQAIELGCVLDESSAGCWTDDQETYCGIIWSGTLEIGCWSLDEDEEDRR